MKLICPICGKELALNQKTCGCENHHSFDMARQGYVNLLTVQQKHSLLPGDTREQVLSRRAFLEEGYYAPILNTLVETGQKYGFSGSLLDIGCGEGYYCAGLSEALSLSLTGLDISKEAVRCAAGKYKGPTWICATAAHIPVEDHSADLITSLFALTLPDEFHRTLKKDGYFFQVLAAEDHLMGLKSVIYDELHHKEKDLCPELEGFQLVESIPIRFSLSLKGQQILNLFSMTPHVFRIGKDGADRLRSTDTLEDIASCILNVYRPL